MPSPESRIGYSQQKEAILKQMKLNSGIRFKQKEDPVDWILDKGKKFNYFTMAAAGVVVAAGALTANPILVEWGTAGLIVDGLGAAGFNHIEQKRKRSKSLRQSDIPRAA